MNNLPEVAEDVSALLAIVANKISQAATIAENMKTADPQALYTEVSAHTLFSLIKDMAHSLDISFRELDNILS